MSLTVRDGLAWLCDPEAAPPKQRNLAQLAAKMRPLAKRLGELRAERPMDVVWSLCGAETTAASRRKRGQLPMEATGFIVLARLEAATRQHDNAAKQAEKEGTS